MGYDPPIVEGPADGDQSNGGSGAGGLAIYGDGHLGDVVIDEDTVLDHTIYADNVTVQAGFTLDLNHWPIYARDTLTVEAGATVHNDGLSAVGVTPGTASTYATPLSPGGYGGEFGGGINGFTTYMSGQVIAPVGAAHVYQADLGSDTASGTDEPLWTDDDNPVIEGDIVWSDLGVQGAGGGAGGQGGLVVIGYDTYTGSAPSIDGGTGGAGTGSGEDGGGGDGGLIIDLPNAD